LGATIAPSVAGTSNEVLEHGLGSADKRVLAFFLTVVMLLRNGLARGVTIVVGALILAGILGAEAGIGAGAGGKRDRRNTSTSTARRSAWVGT
jgi:hypothetical protein